MPQRPDGATLRAWRLSRHWAAQEMARQLRRASGDVHTAEPEALKQMIYAWERGGHGISERYALLYCKVLGVALDRLADGPASSLLPAASAEQDGDDPVDRREFGTAALGLLAGAALPPARIPDTVRPEHVGELRRTAARLCSADWDTGGRTALLREARAHYATARAMLDSSSYTRAVGADLREATAELAISTGFIAFDATNNRLARSLFTEGAILAAGTGNAAPITADAWSLLALQSVYLAESADSGRTGLAREALRFLDCAAAAARNEASPKVHATIAMRRSRAYSLLRDEREVRAHIAIAQRELDRGDHPADPYWTACINPSEVTGHEAMARADLGNGSRAADLFQDVLSDSGLPARNRALYQARLASALTAAGDRSEGAAEGLRVLSVLEGPVRSARTVNQLRPVREQAARDSEFAARFDALAAAL